MIMVSKKQVFWPKIQRKSYYSTNTINDSFSKIEHLFKKLKLSKKTLVKFARTLCIILN